MPETGMSDSEESLDDGRLMQKYGIGFEGGQYVFGEYRYDRLRDAVAYARLLTRRGDT